MYRESTHINQSDASLPLGAALILDCWSKSYVKQAHSTQSDRHKKHMEHAHVSIAVPALICQPIYIWGASPEYINDIHLCTDVTVAAAEMASFTVHVTGLVPSHEALLYSTECKLEKRNTNGTYRWKLTCTGSAERKSSLPVTGWINRNKALTEEFCTLVPHPELSHWTLSDYAKPQLHRSRTQNCSDTSGQGQPSQTLYRVLKAEQNPPRQKKLPSWAL